MILTMMRITFIVIGLITIMQLNDEGKKREEIQLENCEISIREELSEIITLVISEESQAVEQTKSNPQSINYLVGKVMQKTKGEADPVLTLDILKTKFR